MIKSLKSQALAGYAGFKRKISFASDFYDSFENPTCYDVHIERMTCLVISVMNSRNLLGQLSCICQFLSNYTKVSLTTTAITFFCELFGLSDLSNSFVNQSESEDRITLYDRIRDLFRNWRGFRSSPIADKFTEFINYLVAVGLCGENGTFSFSIKNYEVFNIRVKERAFRINDLMDYVFEAIFFFVDEGYAHFQAGTLKSFLCGGTNDATQFSEEYGFITSASVLVANGNLDKSNTDIWDYECRLIKLKEKAFEMMRKAPDRRSGELMELKYNRLCRLETDFRELNNPNAFREAPFSLKIYGPSAIGKSSITNITVAQLRKAAGLSGGPENIATLNTSDKYQSEYKGYTDTVIIDDAMNATPETVDTNPTTLFIKLVNNVPTAALNANAESKGKIYMKPKFLVITTNVSDLESGYYSKEPVSILRRFIHVDPRVRPEFTVSGTTMLDPTKIPDEEMPDLWTFDIRYVVGVGNMTPQIAEYRFVEFEGREMKNVSMKEYLRCISHLSKQHSIAQKKLVTSMEELYNKSFCEHGLYKCLCDSCKDIKSDSVEEKGEEKFENQANLQYPLEKCLDWYFASSRLRLAHKYCRSLFVNKLTRYYMYTRFKDSLQCAPDLYWVYYILCCGFLFGYLYSSVVGLFISFMLSYSFGVYEMFAFDRTLNRLERSRETIPLAIRKNLVGNSAKLFAGFTFLFLVRRLYNKYKWMLTQSGIETYLNQELEKQMISLKPDTNPWKKAIAQDLPCQPCSSTVTVAQMSNIIEKRIACVRTEDLGGKRQTCNALPVSDNCWIVPNHFVFDKQVRCEFIRTNSALAGANFSDYVGRENSVHIEGTDLALVFLSNGGSNKDLTDWFPEVLIRDLTAQMIYKDREGATRIFRFKPRNLIGQNETGYFPGYTYELGSNTFSGLCGATIIHCGRKVFIAGFHLGGISDTPSGSAGTLLRGQLLAARNALFKKLDYHPLPSTGTYKNQMYGVDISASKIPHAKSPMNHLDNEMVLDYYGRVNTTVSSFKSEVRDTMICKDVEEAFGITNIFGPPPAHFQAPWVPIQYYLGNVAKPSIGFDYSILRKARQDYWLSIKPALTAEARSRIFILSEVQNVSGIDGFPGVDALDMSTSVGFPLNKAKSNFLEFLEEYPGISCPRNVDRMFWKEVQECEENYLKGKKNHFIFRAALKDEPTKKTKTKTRVFQCGPLHLTLLLRKYYLTVMAFLSQVTERSECCVGTNATGPEWQKLYDHITTFGEDRCFAGDYASYDTRMPSSHLLAAFQLMIDVARSAGYNDKALSIMAGIASDVTYYITEINGDLVGFYGGNPSGQPGTTHCNCIVNSILMRCCFFKVYPDRQPGSFQKYVKLLTYGDDNVAAVSADASRFNHTTVASMLAEVGIEYTMADKTTESVPFINVKDVSFLKRTFRRDPDTGYVMGPLEIDSIYKSLMSVIKSKVLTDEEACAINLDNAAREFFYHGREVYNSNVPKLVAIAKQHDIIGFTRGLHLSYDDRVASWKEQYLTADPSAV